MSKTRKRVKVGDYLYAYNWEVVGEVLRVNREKHPDKCLWGPFVFKSGGLEINLERGYINWNHFRKATRKDVMIAKIEAL